MERVFAIVTLYYPDAGCVENVRKMAAQTDSIYLCDNSPKSSASLFKGMEHVTYLFFQENKGLSAAFNEVIRRCGENFAPDDFIVYFDQDSTPQVGHIQRLVERFRQLEQAGFSVGCLGPVYSNPHTGELKLPRIRRKIEGNTYAVKSIITSSMLTRFRILQEVDFWNENVFLDMADWDICWRIGKKGHLCCAAEDIVLVHRLGGDVKNEGKETVRRKRMVREYYQMREARYLLYQPYTPFRFRIRFIYQLTLKSWYRLLTFGYREERKAYYRQAKEDAQRGVTGVYRKA